MFWTDGSSYQGEWKKGIQHGYGKMVFPDKSVKEGMFENNEFRKSFMKQKGMKVQQQLLPILDNVFVGSSAAAQMEPVSNQQQTVNATFQTPFQQNSIT